MIFHGGSGPPVPPSESAHVIVIHSLSTSFSEWIISRTGGQPWHYYFIPPTCISVDLAHHQIYHAKVGIIVVYKDDFPHLFCGISFCSKLFVCQRMRLDPHKKFLSSNADIYPVFLNLSDLADQDLDLH